MDDAILTTALDTHTGVALKPVRRVEVLSGMAGRRRIWTLEQKLALVAEMERCDNVAAFARERDVSTALLGEIEQPAHLLERLGRTPFDLKAGKPFICDRLEGFF